MKKYTIKDLAEGVCAAENTGDINKLNELLRLAFPREKEPTSGCFKFYFRGPFFKEWTAWHKSSLPSQPIEDFFEQEKTFPRVMLVSNFNSIDTAYKRVVFMVKNGKYLAWHNAKTLEQAEKIIHSYTWPYAWELEEKIPAFPFFLSKEDALEIINVACNNWKTKLAEMWGTNIVLNLPIAVTEEFYDEMINASTDNQEEVIKKIFKQ